MSFFFFLSFFNPLAIFYDHLLYFFFYFSLLLAFLSSTICAICLLYFFLGSCFTLSIICIQFQLSCFNEYNLKGLQSCKPKLVFFLNRHSKEVDEVQTYFSISAFKSGISSSSEHSNHMLHPTSFLNSSTAPAYNILASPLAVSGLQYIPTKGLTKRPSGLV